jgi:hypothetical protein
MDTDAMTVVSKTNECNGRGSSKGRKISGFMIKNIRTTSFGFSKGEVSP